MASKGDQTRQRILAAVTEMLDSHTFEDISIAEITRRSQVTRPGFYFYFPSKGAAVATLMEELFDDFVAVAEVWYTHDADDPRGALRSGMEATVDLWRAHAHVMHGMAQAAANDRLAREIWHAWVSAFTERAIPTLTADAGARLGELGVPVEQLAEMLIGLTFDAMRRDVRTIVETGEETPNLAASIAYIWDQALY